MKNNKISVYIRPMTLDLLDKYCEAFQLDRSRAVDELLYGRLEWIRKEETKAKKQVQSNEEWHLNMFKKEDK